MDTGADSAEIRSTGNAGIGSFSAFGHQGL
jgi:hypothetical protein